MPAPETDAATRPLPSELAAPGPSEMVTRPDPGLARGKWEASPILIGVVGGAAIVMFFGFLIWKARRARKKAK